MASRPNWKGHLKLSLVSCAVALFTATTEREKIVFHLVNRRTGHRLKRQLVDSESGEPVEAEDQAKGYEVSKGEHVIIEGEDLDNLALDSTRTIDIDGFVPRADITDVYLDTPYYLVPDDKVGEDAFAVIREAMSKRGMAGLARVVLYRRERVVMLEAHRKGIIATTLRYPYEIKDADEAFDAIPVRDVPPEMLQLAEHIIDTKTRTFEPETFKDRYEDAVKDLIAVKTKGRTPRAPKHEDAPGNVVDLMEALRRSVAGPGRPAAATKDAAKAPTATRKAGRKSAAKPRSDAATPAPRQHKAG